jgi:UDP-2,3-diacylglucosamine pyrophosphatase LpxH
MAPARKRQTVIRPLRPYRTVVISDVHIGTGARTCWYQSAVHEPYLTALLDWVITHASDWRLPIGKLVILGDFFDFWMYPPDQRPPTIDDIIAANAAILGPGGKLAEVVAALGGNVTYLRGNHDITIGQADLDRLPLGGHRITLADDILVEGDMVMTHGHLFTMFNAPDPRYPGEQPVGHFVSRAVAHLVENTLAPGQTAADLADQGSPYGFSLDSFAPALLADLTGPSVTSTLLDYFSARCGLPEDAPITMADGSITTLAKAKAKYDGLWDNWVARYGGGEAGETVAAKAVYADYDGTYMAWFAQQAAWDRSATRAVTGHTHIPRLGITNSTVSYLNCGFECPSVPDMSAPKDAKTFNFGVIAPDGTPALWAITEGGAGYVAASVNNPPADQVTWAPFSDFSCYASITNATPQELFRTEVTLDTGYYAVQPPDTIPPGTTRHFWLQDLAGPLGAEGGVSYTPDGGGAPLRFAYGCPTAFFKNYASGGSSFTASSTSPPDPQQPSNVVPPYGHPLFVDFRVEGQTGSAVGDWTPRSLLALAVDAAGFRYDPLQDIIYSKMDPLQRKFGYAYGYDAGALAMNAVIDCEPIFFDYAGKTWMIELWKGQYGLETGCEIGVYNRTIGSSSFFLSVLDSTVGKRPGDPSPEHKLFFDSASDSELLTMSSTLYRKGQRIFSRGPERHWWLTGFRWGLLSDPEDLTMDVTIECQDPVMTSALVGALESMGYADVDVNGNTVAFTFATPKTPQPRAANPQLVSIVRAANQEIVTAYDSLGLANNDPNTVGDQAASVIANAFVIYTEEFFANAVASLAKLLGVDASSVLRTLTEAFLVALDAASQFVTNAGYPLTEWVGAIASFINELLDFSCVIEVSNRGGPYELVLDGSGIVYGDWAVAPPTTIAPGGTARFWLKDPKPSIHGADGWASYSYTDSSGTRQSVRFGFDCPTGLDTNVATTSSGAFGFYTKSGAVTLAWHALDTVVAWGHPLYITFVWGNASLPGDA